LTQKGPTEERSDELANTAKIKMPWAKSQGLAPRDPPGLWSRRRPNSPPQPRRLKQGPALLRPCSRWVPLLRSRSRFFTVWKRKRPHGSERRRRARKCVCRRQTKHGAPKGVRGHAMGVIRLQAGKGFCLLFALKK